MPVSELRTAPSGDIQQAGAHSSQHGKSHQPESVQTFSNISASDSSYQHNGNIYNTFNLSVADEDEKKARRVIDSLYFTDMARRRDTVGPAASETFEWLLDPDMATEEPVAHARALDE